MATAYPGTFPLPKIEGFSASVASGLIRADAPTHQAQRRVYTTMPHRFSLTFVMSVTTWATWQNWMIANGYRWFQISLPTLYAGQAGTSLSSVVVRLVSDISMTPVNLSTVQITVSAESAPFMAGDNAVGLDMSNAQNSQYAPLVFNGI